MRRACGAHGGCRVRAGPGAGAGTAPALAVVLPTRPTANRPAYGGAPHWTRPAFQSTAGMLCRGRDAPGRRAFGAGRQAGRWREGGGKGGGGGKARAEAGPPWLCPALLTGPRHVGELEIRTTRATRRPSQSPSAGAGARPPSASWWELGAARGGNGGENATITVPCFWSGFWRRGAAQRGAVGPRAHDAACGGSGDTA